MSDAQNRDRVYAEKREYKRECRKNNPEKVREIVKAYVQRFRERRKIKIEAQHIASRIIDDIIYYVRKRLELEYIHVWVGGGLIFSKALNSLLQQ